MKWRVVARSEAEDDIIEAARWYNAQRAGLGDEFIEGSLLSLTHLRSIRCYTAEGIQPRTFGGAIQTDSLVA
jgi:hypothetical protein